MIRMILGSDYATEDGHMGIIKGQASTVTGMILIKFRHNKQEEMGDRLEKDLQRKQQLEAVLGKQNRAFQIENIEGNQLRNQLL